MTDLLELFHNERAALVTRLTRLDGATEILNGTSTPVEAREEETDGVCGSESEDFGGGEEAVVQGEAIANSDDNLPR
jgi:hypothetical protein